MKIEIEPEVITAVLEAMSSVAKARIEADLAISRAVGGGLLRLVELVVPIVTLVAQTEAQTAPVERLRDLLMDLENKPDTISVRITSSSGVFEAVNNTKKAAIEQPDDWPDEPRKKSS